jgi:hypothetical protein
VCDKGYNGDYCTSTHLVPFEVVLIVAACVALSGVGLVLVVKRMK